MFIKHIDQVLPSLEGRSDFVVNRKPHYTVIDYVYALPDSFDDPIRRQCRGIKFKPDGTLLATGFHKFFNCGEKPETTDLDFDQPHYVMEKVDGSSIHPAIIEDRVRFMTRMGMTTHAGLAERHLTPQLESGCRSLLEQSLMPIFEWIAPDNRIVIKYDESKLVLLAVRDLQSGKYIHVDEVDGFARDLGVEKVKTYPRFKGTVKEFRENVAKLVGMEGFVVVFHEQQLFVKAKGDEYTLKHKARDNIHLEKNVLALVLNNAVDDVVVMLSPEEAEQVTNYQCSVLSGIQKTCDIIDEAVRTGAELDQKTFATEHVKKFDPRLKSLIFAARQGGRYDTTFERVVDHMNANCQTANRVDDIRFMFNATWDYNMNV